MTLMPGVRANVSAVEASRLLEQAVATEGFHDLWPLGPWPLPGTCVAKDGRLKWPWICRTCGARAGDTSRAVVLARTRCGPLSWEAAPSRHAVVQRGVDSYSCGRCGRQADSAHCRSMEEATCPVPCVLKDGAAWAEGSLALANLLGRIPAFRRWAEPDPATREAPVPGVVSASQHAGPSLPAAPAAGGSGSGAGQSFLAGYRSHLCVVVSRRTVCCACFKAASGGQLQSFRSSQCSGMQPVCGMPAFLRDGLRRRGVEVAGPAALARCKALLDAVGGGQTLLRSCPAGSAGGRGPQAAGSLQASSLGLALMAASRADAA